MTRKSKTSADFKSNLDRLSHIVETLEKGDLSLEESLNQFGQGIQLLKSCKSILTTTEQKVQILLEKNTDPIEFDDYSSN